MGEAFTKIADELVSGLDNHVLNKEFLKNNIPGTECRWIEFLNGGEGTGELVHFKPNWTNFNKFVDENKFYPVAMIAEKMISDQVFGFHTNLTLAIPLYKIIDGGQLKNDANMLCILGSICSC